MISRRTMVTTAIGGAVLAAAIGGTAIASSTSPTLDEFAGDESAEHEDDDTEDEGDDTPITDEDALRQASEAALAWLEAEHGATGTVSETEVGDEESYYEVEVTLEDGREVDVQLTEDFDVVGLD